MTHKNPTRIVACIPYFKCQPYIRRAVTSLLSQTHRQLTVVVVNDADLETPPWPVLADIRDPRLVRFDLAENRGPYFALQVVLNATSAPYLLIQDADDWSHPDRAARLLSAIESERADLAVSAQPQFVTMPNGHINKVATRWHRCRDEKDDIKIPFLIDRNITSRFRYRAPHAGLVSTSTLRRLGGYYGGFRITSDVLLTNCILMSGKVAHVPQPLYHRFIRPGSLTHSPETGTTSAYAEQVRSQASALYTECHHQYLKFLSGKISSGNFIDQLHAIRTSTILPADQTALISETQRLLQHHPNL